MGHVKAIDHKNTADAVARGLAQPLKTLPSWLFYDEHGDRIFEKIMRMPEYYPTRCEYDILQLNKDKLLKKFSDKGRSFRLIELGAGDGLKTEILLRHFVARHAVFTYVPVDISATALEKLNDRLSTRMPQLTVKPLNKTYDEALATLRGHDDRKVVLFLGSNIGNFSVREASQFLKKLALPMSPDDSLLIGFDLKKDPRIILEAYDDPHGLTKEFNINILVRLNRELGADFDPGAFSHYPYYDPETGATRSFLISMKDQSVYIDALGKSVHFGRWETVQTEISQKYDLPMIEKLLSVSGLKIEEVFYDADQFFCDVLAKAR